MLTRPHYSKSVTVNASVIKRKLKPRHHSFGIDAEANLNLIIPSINTAREYNLKEGKRIIYAVMVIFYGKSKDGLARDSSTSLITIGSSNDFIMRHVDKALNKLRQSDAQPRFMRIVYDMNKPEAKIKAEKQAQAVYDAARKLNTAKSFGFTNYNDYLKSLRKLHQKLKHGATEKTLKREAQKIAKEKAKLKHLKEQAKRHAAKAKQAKADAQRQAARVKRIREADKLVKAKLKAANKLVSKATNTKPKPKPKPKPKSTK